MQIFVRKFIEAQRMSAKINYGHNSYGEKK